MDCRETQTLLTAFHDRELPGDGHGWPSAGTGSDAHGSAVPAPDRARVEDHLRGCQGCRALLADLARADAAAGVPDPGPGYWDRFNARVTDRVEREAEVPRATLLRPKRGWVRQQLRYLVPAVAAAAMVVVVVRYGGLHPGAPPPLAPPMVREPAAPDSPGQRLAKAKPESDGHGWPGPGAGRDATGSAAPAPESKKAGNAGIVRRATEDSARVTDERNAAAAREERDRLADRPLREAKEGMMHDRAGVPAVGGVASPPPAATYRAAPPVSPPVPAAEPQLAASAESDSGISIGKDSPRGEPSTAMTLGKARERGVPAPLASATTPAPSPCELARTLAAQGRLRDAETAQRACLAKDRTAPAQENGLVFLAELLDRQERFADADAILTEVHRQFPESRPLDLYRQQRPMVQKQPTGVPVLR